MDVLYLKSADTGSNSLLLRATVRQGGRGKINVVTLLDSGCTALSFMDNTFARDYNFDILCLPKPKQLRLTDGERKNNVTEFVAVTMEGITEEHKARLDVRYHAFVDDLFDKHFINRVTDKDIEKYLKGKKPATVQEIKKKLPPDYHDLINLFLPSKATKLPKHRSYNHCIDIEPGKSIPSSKTRPMSQSEL
ncbi:Uu.00g052910.m01.CDS01 [Anthostomella pinea]|uniref:Uu.00g052910.m01.CDS01 n=1 Tax=Anthostomella pinea TaxID=933095 RepID=A0AAI8YPL3_9PEZI|nr:Uu.00g052910.m01.CDS01 [Anthostomella pinea]